MAVAARLDGVIEQSGPGVSALQHSLKSAFGFDPFEHQADDVNRESRGRVIERLLLDMGAVLKKRGEVPVRALGEILANDDDGDAGGPQVFLGAGENEPELSDVDDAPTNVARHARAD